MGVGEIQQQRLRPAVKRLNRRAAIPAADLINTPVSHRTPITTAIQACYADTTALVSTLRASGSLCSQTGGSRHRQWICRPAGPENAQLRKASTSKSSQRATGRMVSSWHIKPPTPMHFLQSGRQCRDVFKSGLLKTPAGVSSGRSRRIRSVGL